MSKKETINVRGTDIAVISSKGDDYISLTDMAGYKDSLEARVVVSNWMSTRFTLEFLAIWEQVNNPDFNRMEFHTVKNAAGRLVMTPNRWVEQTNAIGIFSKSGRYGGGIFAHKDIAFEFGSWLAAGQRHLQRLHTVLCADIHVISRVDEPLAREFQAGGQRQLVDVFGNAASYIVS